MCAVPGNSELALTRFEDFSFPELAVWRVDRLFGPVIPTHSYPELPHPSAAHGFREWGRNETMRLSRFLQLITLENLSNDGLARIIRVTQV